jgi:hypothetical protein
VGREKRGPVRFKLSSLYPLTAFAMVNVRDLAGVVNAWKLLISPDPRQELTVNPLHVYWFIQVNLLQW